MQKAKDLCVGSFGDHESYPYERYLLEHYKGPRGLAFDFGCGVGRMIKRMLFEFRTVEGGELLGENIKYAEEYLSGCDQHRYSLYKLDGMGADVGKYEYYDFVYSTICIHHIAPFSLRNQIVKDLYKTLKRGGGFSIQVVFGIDTGNHWFDNHYQAGVSANVVDVSIPTQDHFHGIEKWLNEIGFLNVKFDIQPCPHPNAIPALKWLFIYAEKQ
jgi:SAM-dependent methyltransferase